MTTRIEITNKGPEELGIWFYDSNGASTNDHPMRLKVGESYEFDTHDGKRAMPFALRGTFPETPRAADGEIRAYSVPPAHY